MIDIARNQQSFESIPCRRGAEVVEPEKLSPYDYRPGSPIKVLRDTKVFFSKRIKQLPSGKYVFGSQMYIWTKDWIWVEYDDGSGSVEGGMVSQKDLDLN